MFQIKKCKYCEARFSAYEKATKAKPKLFCSNECRILDQRSKNRQRKTSQISPKALGPNIQELEAIEVHSVEGNPYIIKVKLNKKGMPNKC